MLAETMPTEFSIPGSHIITRDVQEAKMNRTIHNQSTFDLPENLRTGELRLFPLPIYALENYIIHSITTKERLTQQKSLLSKESMTLDSSHATQMSPLTARVVP